MRKYAESTHRRLTYPEINQIYRRIGDLKDSFGVRPNPRVRAEAMIGACISEGVDVMYEILKMLGASGLSKKLVRGVLEERTGPIPGDHLWQCDDEGRYRLN